MADAASVGIHTDAGNVGHGVSLRALLTVSASLSHECDPAPQQSQFVMRNLHSPMRKMLKICTAAVIAGIENLRRNRILWPILNVRAGDSRKDCCDNR